MSRRRSAIAAATSLVAVGVIPLGLKAAFALDEPTPGCFTVSDDKGDALLLGAAPNDPDLDIIGLTMQATASSVVSIIKVDKLDTHAASALGHSFYVNFTSGGKAVSIRTTGYPVSALNTPADTLGEATKGQPVTYSPSSAMTVAGSWAQGVTVTALFDVAKSRVVLSVPRAQMNAALPSFTDGSEITALTVRDATSFPLSGGFYVDSTAAANAAAGTAKWIVGDNACFAATPGGGETGSPSASPSASATPTATASPTPTPTPTGTPGAFEEAPYAFPRTGCQLFTDATGDGAASPFSNDADLDVTSVSVKTTATAIQVMTKVATLGDKPGSPQNGDRFEVSFKLGGKTFAFGAGRQDSVATTAGAPSANRNTVNGTADTKLKATPTFDKTKNTVILAIDRAALETVAGVPAPVGTALTSFVVKTYGYFANRETAADTAQAAAAADQQYTVGDNLCFYPPAAVMEWLGDDTVTAQYGDLVEAAVGLSTDSGDPLEGRTVTFTLGTATVTGTTDADGVADVFLPALAAGTSKVTAAFGGDADNYKTTFEYPVTVTPEATKITLAVTKAGTARTVTATLVDDDKPKANPIAGQTLTVLVNGKKAGTVKTDAKGKAVWKTAKIGQTVKFTLAAVPGKYAAASAQQKLT